MSTQCLPKSRVKNVYFKSSYRCKICKNSFKKFTIFEGHFAFNVGCRAKNGWFIQCYVCGQKFRYLAELKYHIRLHPIQKRKPTDSELQTDCKLDFSRASENGDAHTNGYECNICQRHCRTKFYLNEHLLSHSKEVVTTKPVTNGDPDVRAMDQLSSFSEVDSDLAKEEETTHANGLKCDTCNLSFTTNISLKLHRKLVHRSGTADEPADELQCDICQTRFSYAGNLKRHKLMHTTGNVECEICHIKFTKKSLVKHEKEAHPELLDDKAQSYKEITTPPISIESVEPPIESEVNTAISPDIIMSETTPEIDEITTPPPTEEQANVNCDLCGKSIASIHLHLHLKTHRQCTCWICGKLFKNRTGLINHSRWHRFECYICKTVFSSFKRLAIHIGKHLVYEQWVDPASVRLSNWIPEIVGEILQNQPLVMVERLDVLDVNRIYLTDSAVLNKSKEIDRRKMVGNDTQIVENSAEVSPIANGESDDETEVNDFKKVDNPSPIIDLSVKTELSKCVADYRTLSFDDDGIVIVEQQPDTTTNEMDDDNAIDISSESDIDEMELYHCYFCNETFRSLDSLGVHVKKCSHCP